jgi:hypothetical protein
MTGRYRQVMTLIPKKTKRISPKHPVKSCRYHDPNKGLFRPAVLPYGYQKCCTTGLRSALVMLHRGALLFGRRRLWVVLVDEADLDRERGFSFGRTTSGCRHSAVSAICKVVGSGGRAAYVRCMRTGRSSRSPLVQPLNVAERKRCGLCCRSRSRSPLAVRRKQWQVLGQSDWSSTLSLAPTKAKSICTHKLNGRI